VRTTITIDDDLARRLQDEMRTRGTSFRQTLEGVLARGLEQRTAQAGAFRVQARPMGLKAGIDPARLQDLETDLEVERFLAVARRQIPSA
jgi:L-serine deaminase